MVHIRNITDAELCMRFLFWTWKDEYYIQSLLLCGRRPGLPAPGRTGNIQPKISVDQSGNGCGIGYPVFPHRRKYDYHAACIRIVPDLCARKKSGGILSNRCTRFVSSISMEIYLCHMMLFRVIERTGLHKAFGDGWIQYAVTVAAVLVGTALFAVVMQKIFEVIGKRIMHENSDV